MLKRILFALSLMTLCLLEASEVQLNPLKPPLRYHLSEIDRTFHIMLEDGSCFQVMGPLSKRGRSLYEWIQGVEPAEWSLDPSFYCDPSRWSPQALLAVHDVVDSPFQGYSFVLENTQNKQKVFATLQSFEEMLIPKSSFALHYFSQSSNTLYTILHAVTLDHHVLALDNGRYLKILPTSYRYRTFFEWLSGSKIEQPDENFIFKPTDFSAGDSIQIFSADLRGQDAFLRGTGAKEKVYLIENSRNGKLAYAVQFSIKEVVAQLENRITSSYDQGYQDGYSYGYARGKRKGYEEGQAAANNPNLSNPHANHENPNIRP
jgi:hypothetical protein